jgi:hypothetical protein
MDEETRDEFEEDRRKVMIAAYVVFCVMGMCSIAPAFITWMRP